MVSLLQSQGRSLRVLGCWEGAHCVYAANVDGDCQQATNQCEFERKVTTCEHVVTCIQTTPLDITNDHVSHELLINRTASEHQDFRNGDSYRCAYY